MMLPVFGFSQVSEEEDSPAGRWFTGGGFNIGVASDFTIIGVSPFLGYHFSDKLSAGGGPIYNYYKTPFFSSSTYGGRLMGQFLITPELFARSEFHVLNVESSHFSDLQEEGRVWTPAWFVGGGYRQQIAPKTYAQASIMFDIIEDENTPYQNPYISVGVQVNL